MGSSVTGFQNSTGVEGARACGNTSGISSHLSRLSRSGFLWVHLVFARVTVRREHVNCTVIT
jgi:hypothetical protein